MSEQSQTFEKVADLYTGLSLYKVHVDRTREQPLNAQVMDKKQFERLQANIAQDKRLESLPFGYLGTEADGPVFWIISGHHRVRAAKGAGVEVIFVMVIEDLRTKDEIAAKQLAHNALVGESDTQMLKEIYQSIQSVDERYKSGIMEPQLDREKFKDVTVQNVDIDFNFKAIKVLFLDSQAQNFDKMIETLKGDDRVYIANKDDYDKFAAMLRELSGVEDIRNIGSLMGRVTDIVQMYLKDPNTQALKKQADPDGKAKKKAISNRVRTNEG